MVNGKPGDHPITDMFTHGMHPFPLDIEEMLREILKLAPDFPDDKRFGHYYSDQIRWEQHIFDMAAGDNLDEGREALRKVLEELREEHENRT